jgi:signal transduction histidine kinase
VAEAEDSLQTLRVEIADLRASRGRIAAAADAERRTIERELHDGAQQQLIALSLNIQLARELAASDVPALERLLEEITHDVHAVLDDLRGLAWRVYPSLLLDAGLVEALRAAASDSAVPTRVTATVPDRLPAAVEAAVYFCCIDVLRSAADHARGVARATVDVAPHDGSLVFEVTVEGAGLAPPESDLTAARDRIDTLGGLLTITAGPGTSARVRGAIPLDA